jgi:hypothetical protein
VFATVVEIWLLTAACHRPRFGIDHVRPPVGDEVQRGRREQEPDLERRHVLDLGPDLGVARDLGDRVEEADRDDRDGEQDLDDAPHGALSFGRGNRRLAFDRRAEDVVGHIEARGWGSVARPKRTGRT